MGNSLQSEVSDQLRGLADVLANFSEGFVVLDGQWRFVFLNATALKLLQLTEEAAKGKVFWDVFDCANGSTLDTEFRQVRNDQVSARFEWYSPVFSCWLAISAHPLQDGIAVYFSDITAQKSSQDTPGRSETHFRNMVENLPAGAVLREGDRLWLNKAAERMVGYKQSEISMIADWFEKLHRDDPEGARKRYDKFRQSGFPRREMSQITCKDGAVHHVEFTGYLDDAGEIWLLNDVTDRLMTEEKFRILFEYSSTPYFLFGKSGVSDCNIAALKQLGWTEKKQVVGRSFLSFAPEYQADGLESKKRLAKVNELLKRNGQCNFEWNHLRSDGTSGTVFVSASKFLVGHETMELVIWQDLTLLKEAEDQLRQNEERYRTILENTDEIIYTLGLDGRFIFVSKSWTRHLGHSVEEVEGHRFVEFVHEEDRKKGLEYTIKLFKDPSFHGACQYRAINKDGTVRWHETHGSAVRGKDGKVLHFVGLSHDVTERREAREALEEARDAALANSRAKSQFLATVSHEIRTPLNGVLGMTNLLADTELSKEQRSYVRTIQSSGEVLRRVIDDVLDYSRIEAGKLTISPLAIDVVTALEDVVSLFKGSAQEKGITLGLDWNGIKSLMVYADPARVKQVVANLVGNAVKFTEEGGVQVNARLIRETPTAVLLRVEIIDTGIGISPDRVQAIFEGFTQGDSSMHRRYGGSGLGLTISKRLTDLMGGTIEVESEAGVGSRFWVELPLSKINKSAAKPKDDTSNVSLSGVRILLAEDNFINVEVARRQIERFGCVVDVADNGQEAVDMSAAHTYSVVLMDVQMPVMDGLHATRTIRTRKKETGGHLPIVALTATAFAEDKKACEDAGMDGFLPKPFKLEDLEAALKKWVAAAAVVPEAESQ